MRNQNTLMRILAAALVLCLSLTLLFAAAGAAGESQSKTVRVGWYESSFNTMDDIGRRTGYAYEYQQKIAAYTGWQYEYIEGSWPELMEMLAEGKIDLMSDVSYTKERSEKMLYSTLAMGAEEYYLFTTPDNDNISAKDYATFNGKKIGALKDSIQIQYFKEWEKTNGVKAQVVELNGTETDNIAKLIRGDFDLYLSPDPIADIESTVPVCNVASSDFYFAVNKSRRDLLAELNDAMSRIQDDNRYYNQELYNKYLRADGFNRYLSTEETQWLYEHGPIRVGYQDNYLAFCAQDKETGKLIGALGDYLNAASTCLENAKPQFEAVCYPTAEAALEAMKKGEVDCMFPANLSDSYGEVGGYLITAPLMETDMSAIVLESAQKTFFDKERVTVAVNAGNPNYDMFLVDNFPAWLPIYFKDTQECLRAVAEGKADCLLISNFRYNNISDYCNKYKLTALSTGVQMNYCFAVARNNAMLYSILNKINNVVPASAFNAALSHYFTEDAKTSLADLLQQNAGFVALIFAGIIVLILVLSLLSARSERKASAHQKLIAATETDELTGLYNKNYFFVYANRLYRETPEIPMDAVVLNIDRFHSVNAIYGHYFGDRVLCEFSRELLAFVEENGGIAGHAEADHFLLYCPHLEDCGVLFDRLQNKLETLSSSASITLRMGVMPWEKDTPPQQLFEQAFIACNKARDVYREHMLVFDEAMGKREAFEQKLLNDLRRALENDEFEVHYQPKYDIQSEQPKLIGAEALVRWNHPDFGMIAPAHFIPLFERSGQIREIDKYVWTQATAQIAYWRDIYGFVLPISINLSRVDVFDPKLETILEALLKENRLSHDALELEITESAFTDSEEQLINIVETLRQRGFRIAMDDFGAGYSSLNILSAMPIDSLKMDSAFIKDIKLNRKGLQFVELILNIAENLKVPVVAEGVETETQLQLLKNMGCAQVQGYYFSKPVPAAEFEKKFLEN